MHAQHEKKRCCVGHIRQRRVYLYQVYFARFRLEKFSSSCRMADASTAPSPVTPTRSPKLSMKGAEFQAQLRAVFHEFDADGSGSVDTAEIQAMTAKLGMTFSTEEIEAMVRDADTNGNGVLEFDEFEQVIKAHLGKGASANGLGACRSRSRACRSRSRAHPRPAMSPRSVGSRARVCACANGPRRLHLRLARQ